MKSLRQLAMIAVASTACLSAAASDFGTWLGAEADKKLGNFSFTLGAGFRAQNNLKSVDRWDAALGVEYKPFKFLKFAAGYTYIYSYNIEKKRNRYEEYEQANEDGTSTWVKEFDGYNINKPMWRSKSRFNFDIAGNVDVGRFNISLRERYQYTHMAHTYYTRDKYRVNEGTGEVYFKESERRLKRSKDNNRLRSKLQAEYDIRKCILTPYAYVELFNELDNAMTLGKTRVGVGTDIKLSKAHRLSVGYVYQDENDDDMGETQHVIDISYKFKF